MARGELDKRTLEQIDKKIPALSSIEDRVLTLSPDVISIKFPYTSTVPIAAVCLQDTVYILTEVRYALHEIYAHRIWYLETGIENNKAAATYFSKFYADDIALRLYAAAEHLASAIKAMLEIDENEIAKIKKLNVDRVSVARAVGTYLIDQKPNLIITRAISSLIESEEWQKIIRYRNKWVHEQPPLIDGLGIVWKRRTLWKDKTDSKQRTLRIGSGDTPELTISELITIAHSAVHEFIETVDTVLNYYIDLLAQNGIRFESNSLKLNPFHKN